MKPAVGLAAGAAGLAGPAWWRAASDDTLDDPWWRRLPTSRRELLYMAVRVLRAPLDDWVLEDRRHLRRVRPMPVPARHRHLRLRLLGGARLRDQPTGRRLANPSPGLAGGRVDGVEHGPQQPGHPRRRVALDAEELGPMRAVFTAAPTGHRDLDQVTAALAGVFGVEQLEPGRWIVLTPFSYGDGDGLSVFITRRTGDWTLTDFGALRVNPDHLLGYPTEQVHATIGRIAEQYGITYTPGGPAYRGLAGPPRLDDVADFVMFTIAAATVAGALPNGLPDGNPAVPARPQE